MIIEDLRLIHEDIERLQQAIAERLQQNPIQIRDRLARDHQIAGFVDRIRIQSERALEIYEDASGALLREEQSLSQGDGGLSAFRERLEPIKDFHRRYPNEPVEVLERSYKYPPIKSDGTSNIDNLFTGEEAFGRYFDLLGLHEEYNNIRKKRSTYLQFLDSFDDFDLFTRSDKLREEYFGYLTSLAQYLEGFMRKTRPLEDVDAVVAAYGKEFDELWANDEIAGWKPNESEKSKGPVTEGSGEGTWCADCQKEFTNPNVYKAHLTAKKHIKNAEARKAAAKSGANEDDGPQRKTTMSIKRLKERAIAEREFLIVKLAKAMQTERSDTRVNVERRQGMTEKERAQEIEALYADVPVDENGQGQNGRGGEDGEEKKDNPLRLPLQWDGKPIPFWLYKLHGLGVEFTCEICGNFVYMGRRAFDKHFSEPRHLYGLKCLGITNAALFREITKIQEAEALWEKVRRDKKVEAAELNDVEQMEDSQGNVMPIKVYHDLLKAGLL